MGKSFCVCNNANQENDTDIFSKNQNNNKPLERDTIKTLNSINQTSGYKTIQDDNSTDKNYALNILLNEMYKNKNNNNADNKNKLLSDTNKNENFNCSGKFHVLQTNSNQQIINGGNENDANNSLNISENKNIYNNNINKNEMGFTSFKSFFDCNNNNNTGEMRINKDNNTDHSLNNGIIKKEITNKSSEFNDTQKREQNSFSICKDNKNENGNLNNDNDFRYNNISQYSDVSDKDYLNNESNYYNSNKREENRDNQSLYNEESQNTENEIENN